MGASFISKVCERTSVCLPVLHDIVKRRFVRVPILEPGLEGSITLCNWPGVDGVGSSRKMLNLAHMIGCLTAPSDRSREAGLFKSNSLSLGVWFCPRGENWRPKRWILAM
jgi:hypothetical protein